MAATFDTHHGIETTIGLLQAELPRLEEQQRTLEKQLAAVTERTAAVQDALRSLHALSSAVTVPEVSPEGPEAAHVPAAALPQPVVDDERPEAPVPAPRQAQDDPTAATPVAAEDEGSTGLAQEGEPARVHRSAGRSRKQTAKHAKSVKKTSPSKRTQGLSESIVAFLEGSEGPLRAGEVNKALGRENTSGSVNSVRTALERLVAASRVQRVERGLYQAPQS